MTDPALDRVVALFAPADASIAAYADALRREGVLACCFDRGSARGAAPTPIAGARLGLILETVAARGDGYVWEAGPAGLVALRPEDGLLDAPAPAIRSRGRGMWKILSEDLAIAERGITPMPGLDPPDAGPAAIDVPAGRLIDVLNAFAAAHPGLVWHLAGPRDGPYALGFTVVENAR